MSIEDIAMKWAKEEIGLVEAAKKAKYKGHVPNFRNDIAYAFRAMIKSGRLIEK